MPDAEQLYPGNYPSTPEQVAQMRAYALELQKASMAPTANSWTGVLAQALMGLRGQQQMNQATGLQIQGLNSAAAQDPNARMLLSRGLLGNGAPPVNPIQPQAASGTPAGGLPLKAAILMQESGNNSNIRPSVAGAVGPGQIMPATFRQFAQPGEDIRNPDANRAVSGRILDSYMEKYGDPARAAVAYFSGPGNVAPPGSPTPWISDKRDGNGKSVSSYVSDVTGRMGGGGQQVAQAGGQYGAYQHNPWANPKEQDLARGLITPAPGSDVYGRPTLTSPMGGQTAVPVGPGVQPGVPGQISLGAGGAISAPTQVLPPDATNPTPLAKQFNPLFDLSRRATQAGARSTAEGGATKEAIEQGYGALPVLQTLATMKDDIKSHGDKMIWGPTADWLNNLKRGIAQHAPGLMSDADMAGLASADSFEKLSAQLQTMVGRMVGPTDASLLQGMRSVPGSHNSKEGALALIDMLQQVARLQTKFGTQVGYMAGQPNFDLLAAKNKFYEDNPIINPISGHELRLDLTGKKPEGATANDEWGIKRR